MTTTTRRPLSPTSETPLGLVLSGGGARGVFQVGVWDVLMHDGAGLGRLPHVVSGTSAGAINGALIAAGLTPAQMLEFWLDLARRPPVEANPTFFRSLESAVRRLLSREPGRGLRDRGREARLAFGILRRHKLTRRSGRLAMLLEYLLTARFDSVSAILDDIKTTHLFSTQRARARLAKAIGGYTLERPRCRLAINTVDVRSGKVVRFASHAPRKHDDANTSHYQQGPITVDMIMASAAIPLLFDPVRVEGRPLWDGGLLVNTPLAPTVALGADVILPVLVTSGAPDRAAPRTLGQTVERLADAFLENAFTTDRKLLLERNRVAAAHPDQALRVVDLYEPVRPTPSETFNAGSYLYFEPDALMEMYEAGRRAARAWLARGPRLDLEMRPRRVASVERTASSSRPRLVDAKTA